jgi:hypothetical protein
MSLSKLLREAAIQKPSSRWLVVGNAVFATSDFFFHDGDNRPVAVVVDDYDGSGHWELLERSDVERRNGDAR